MNLIRTAFSTSKRFLLLPHCTIAIQQLSTTTNCTLKVAHFFYKSWSDLMKNPMDWRDYREDKLIGLVKPKYPDFKHKTNGTYLWLNTAPKWVFEEFNVRKGKKDDSWKNLVENPEKWWDNRPRKTNVNAPDFIHKETNERLWQDHSPKWVLAELEGLNLGKRKKEDSWKNLVENPNKWWDKRPRKVNVKEPDFIHKETSEALWLDSSPKWVLAMLERLNVGKGKKKDNWKNFVDNPDLWWDNRSTKTNVKSPDFKHKETGEVLWLDSSPKWVLAVLEGLNLGKGEKEDSWKNLVENPDKWMDNRPTKTNVKEPDFRHKETCEGLWLDNSPKWVSTVLEELNMETGKKEDSWMNLVENSDKWWDKRSIKSNVNRPDFVHKETSDALWLDSAPKWVLAMLEGLNMGKTKKDDSWKNFLENPSKWWDNRPIKTNVNSPDFVHKDTGEGLWLGSSPKWVLPWLEGVNVGKGKTENRWKNLVENPDNWWDNRSSKTNVKAPDFKHKETGEGLWIDAAPKWVVLAGKEGINLAKRKKEDSWKNLVENPDNWLDNRPRKTYVEDPDFIHKETNEALWLESYPKWLLSQLPC